MVFFYQVSESDRQKGDERKVGSGRHVPLLPIRENESSDGDVGEHDDDVHDDGDGDGVGGHEVLVADFFVDQPASQLFAENARRNLR